MITSVDKYIGIKKDNLLILEFSHYNKWKIKNYKCICDCGNIKTIAINNLMTGTTKSCGCLNKILLKHNTRKYNGLDRINSKKGYEIENVVPCCKTCNFAKNDNSYEEFVTYIKKLRQFNEK